MYSEERRLFIHLFTFVRHDLAREKKSRFRLVHKRLKVFYCISIVIFSSSVKTYGRNQSEWIISIWVSDERSNNYHFIWKKYYLIRQWQWVSVKKTIWLWDEKVSERPVMFKLISSSSNIKPKYTCLNRPVLYKTCH